MRGLSVTFSPCGGPLICHVFHHVGLFLLLFLHVWGGGGLPWFFVVMVFLSLWGAFWDCPLPPKTSSCAHGVGAWAPTQFFVSRGVGGGQTPKNAPIRKNDSPHEKKGPPHEKIKCPHKEKKMPPHVFFSGKYWDERLLLPPPPPSAGAHDGGVIYII